MELRHDTQKNRKEDKKGEEKDTSKLKAILASSLLVGTIATVNSCVFDGQWGLRDEEDATYVDAGEETGVEFDADRDAGVDAETVEPDARVDGGDTDTRVDADEVDLDGGDAEVHEDADTSEDADARVDGGDTELDADEVDLDGGDADSVDLDADAPTCEVFNEIWEGYIRAGAGQNVGGYIVSYLGEGGTDGRYTISCESSGTVIVENEVFADRETTVIEVPEDGKRIVLYPRTTNPGSADITITVENL